MARNPSASSSSSSGPTPTPTHFKLDEPGINSSKYEAYSIQSAIRRLATIKSEVEEEVLAAISSGKTYPKPGSSSNSNASTRVIPAGSKRGRNKSRNSGATTNTNSSTTGKSGSEFLVQPERVFGPATKKLNVPATNKLYHDLMELSVPPNQIKIKRPPKCEKKVDPMPCLQDYIQPKYCCIKPARDHNEIRNYCKRDELPEISNTEDDDYFFSRSEPPFKMG